MWLYLILVLNTFIALCVSSHHVLASAITLVNGKNVRVLCENENSPLRGPFVVMYGTKQILKFPYAGNVVIQNSIKVGPDDVIQLTINDGDKECGDFHKLVVIDNKDQVTVLGLGKCQFLPDASLEGEQIIFTNKSYKDSPEFYYKNRKITTKSKREESRAEISQVTIADAVERFRCENKIDFLYNKDFKATLVKSLELTEKDYKNILKYTGFGVQNCSVKDETLSVVYSGKIPWGSVSISITKSGKYNLLVMSEDAKDCAYYTNDAANSKKIDSKSFENLKTYGLNSPNPLTSSIPIYYKGSSSAFSLTTEIEPCNSDFYQRYKLFSDYTDVQRKKMLKDIIGKNVKWKLDVYEVREIRPNYFVVSLITKDCVTANLIVENPDHREMMALEAIMTGDKLEFMGEIVDYDFPRTFIIKSTSALKYYKKR